MTPKSLYWHTNNCLSPFRVRNASVYTARAVAIAIVAVLADPGLPTSPARTRDRPSVLVGRGERAHMMTLGLYSVLIVRLVSIVFISYTRENQFRGLGLDNVLCISSLLYLRQAYRKLNCSWFQFYCRTLSNTERRVFNRRTEPVHCATDACSGITTACPMDPVCLVTATLTDRTVRHNIW